MRNESRLDVRRLRERFVERFGRADIEPEVFFAPGRVNLIGEYTDFTGGLVFPCGVDRGTLLIARRNRDSRYRLASTNFDLTAELSQEEIPRRYGENWINYPLGVLDRFRRGGVELDGIDCLYAGNIPNGAGLSSSASIEVVTAWAVNELFDAGLLRLELVKLAQAAENEFVGMQCGIMDQFAVAFAEEGARDPARLRLARAPSGTARARRARRRRQQHQPAPRAERVGLQRARRRVRPGARGAAGRGCRSPPSASSRRRTSPRTPTRSPTTRSRPAARVTSSRRTRGCGRRCRRSSRETSPRSGS